MPFLWKCCCRRFLKPNERVASSISNESESPATCMREITRIFSHRCGAITPTTGLGTCLGIWLRKRIGNVTIVVMTFVTAFLGLAYLFKLEVVCLRHKRTCTTECRFCIMREFLHKIRIPFPRRRQYTLHAARLEDTDDSGRRDYSKITDCLSSN